MIEMTINDFIAEAMKTAKELSPDDPRRGEIFALLAIASAIKDANKMRQIEKGR